MSCCKPVSSCCQRPSCTLPSCPPGCKSSCCASFSCSNVCRIPEDPVAHLRDMLVKQLSGSYESATNEINEFIGSIGRRLNENDDDVDASEAILTLNEKVKKITSVQTAVATELATRSSKKDECLSWSYGKAKTCFYFSNSTLAKILTIAGLMWGWYQIQIGGSGTVVTAIAIGLFIFQFAFEKMQERVKEKLDVHHFSILELRGLKAKTELEVERTGNFLRIFQSATIQLPTIKGDAKLRNQAELILNALPSNFRKSFSVEGLTKLSKRAQTLPPSHRSTPSRQMDLATVRRAFSSDEGEGAKVRFLEPPVAGDSGGAAREIRVTFQEPEREAESALAVPSVGQDEGSGISFVMHEDKEPENRQAGQSQEQKAIELTAVTSQGGTAAQAAAVDDEDDEFLAAEF